jgi:hypothetical protein
MNCERQPAEDLAPLLRRSLMMVRNRRLKIVFCDIDGVLVNRASLEVASAIASRAAPECVERLNHICRETKAVIVVTSSWRRNASLTWLREIFRTWGVKARVHGMTPTLNIVRRRGMIGGLRYAQTTRGDEIKAWIRQNGKPEAFVILDDDIDVTPYKRRLVKTEFEAGLREADGNRAIQLLNANRP